MGFSGYLEHFKRTYPLTTRFIESVHESTNDFRKRRIRNILATKLKDVEVSLYLVTELAHVRTYIRQGETELKQYIEELIKEHNMSFNTSDFWE